MNSYELADDVIDMLESWSEAYPISMFPDPTQKDIDYINAENKNLSARFFAHTGRHFINKGFTPAINMLRQQADRITKLEAQVDKLLAHCDDPECWECGKIICPYGGEMHFHHDGCPTCAQMEYRKDK